MFVSRYMSQSVLFSSLNSIIYYSVLVYLPFSSSVFLITQTPLLSTGYLPCWPFVPIPIPWTYLNTTSTFFSTSKLEKQTSNTPYVPTHLPSKKRRQKNSNNACCFPSRCRTHVPLPLLGELRHDQGKQNQVQPDKLPEPHHSIQPNIYAYGIKQPLTLTCITDKLRSCWRRSRPQGSCCPHALQPSEEADWERYGWW